MKTILTLLMAAAALMPLTAAAAAHTGMPRAALSAYIDSRSCIEVTVYKDIDDMSPAERERFLREYPADTLCSLSDGTKRISYNASQLSELTAAIRKRRDALLAAGVAARDIRLYLRNAFDIAESRARMVIRCAAEAGVNQLLITASPQMEHTP